MKIYDISQEVFSCCVYEGDPEPKKTENMRIARGDEYNLTSFGMCAHNGTHLDAPFHFIADGKSVDEIELNKTVGNAYVVKLDGDITSSDAEAVVNKALALNEDASRRILIKGSGTLTAEAARSFAERGIYLIASESQSVGSSEVHKIFLEKETVLLEGVVLSSVEEGVYFLSAQPLKLAGSDGAPCRAILIDF